MDSGNTYCIDVLFFDEPLFCVCVCYRFLQKNQGTFFLSAYDGPKAPEGSGKDKES